MKLSIPLLKRTHVVALLCFFLPFLEFNCGFSDWTAEEKAASEKAQMDSISAYEISMHRIPENSAQENIKFTTDSFSEKDKAKKLESIPQKQFEFKNILWDILLPNGKCSGIYLAVLGVCELIDFKDNFSFVFFTVYFLLIIYSLVNFFYPSKKSFRRIFTSSILQLLCLILFVCIEKIPISEMLYGYWITVVVCFFNAITSYFIWKKQPE